MLSTVSGPVRPAVPPRLPGVGDTQHRLMEAAADAFADKGFHATTTRDIAARAGLSPAGVYIHFASKEALLFALSERGHEAVRDLIVEAVEAAPTPAEALGRLLATFSQWHAEHYRVGRIVQYEFTHLTPEHQAAVRRLRREIDGVVERVLRAGVGSGAFAVDDVRATVLALLSLCVDVARWYEPGIRRSPAQIGATNASLGLRLVSAAPPTAVSRE